eukprot:symbB.v1.2.014268.t1/scaffold1033.1/size247163/6
MERRMLMVVSDKSSDFASVQRRALADATSHFENACIEKMHHVGYVDLSKFGRLTVPDITEVVKKNTPSDYVTPESGTFFSHEQGRSLTDKEETAQWVTIRYILDACLSKVSSIKGNVLMIHHYTAYDGTLKKVVCDMMTEFASECYIAGYSQSQNPTTMKYSVVQVVFEESSSERGGCADSAPMTFHNLMIMLEKKGVFDAKVTGHNVSRPPSVQRGEEADRQVSNSLAKYMVSDQAKPVEPFDDPALELKRQLAFDSQEMEEPYWNMLVRLGGFELCYRFLMKSEPASLQEAPQKVEPPKEEKFEPPNEEIFELPNEENFQPPKEEKFEPPKEEIFEPPAEIEEHKEEEKVEPPKEDEEVQPPRQKRMRRLQDQAVEDEEHTWKYAGVKITSDMDPVARGGSSSKHGDDADEKKEEETEESKANGASAEQINHKQSSMHQIRWNFVQAYIANKPGCDMKDAHDAWMKSSERAAVLASRAGTQVIPRKSDGATALFGASWNGHFTVAQCLLELGANTEDATTDNGETPLLAAAQNGYLHIVRLLAIDATGLLAEERFILKLMDVNEALPGEAGGSKQPTGKAKKTKSEGVEVLPSTQELLEKEMPGTPRPDKHSECLLEDALGAPPAPARKQNLKLKIGLKKPAAAKVCKKPASKGGLVKSGLDKRNLDYRGKKLRIMVYHKTTAVVADTVSQLFQVVTFKDVKKNEKAAKKLMGMLQNGDIHCVRDAVIRGDRSIINNLEKATKISNDNMKKMVETSTEANRVETEYLDKKIDHSLHLGW